ncbi:aminotransferase class V-fold PLP-dependent enzyme [Acetohalobium arabaticum]|uniref:cysteine desulfurase n=1 Tax=Acetohalobium arabaticum (strain ATCC 49924 / DSM 5501 / Z-7288) TaxID=574087 RepID=D9QUL9_ACEAZ|nr:aminotransferase class V-fold PLP-dependent enzyme [Acetohalobium arabaticum]ADL13820.1 cysteine desulfurase family protein [Acetohalobium arabaticum DSM 5501]
MIYLDNAATSFPKPETVYQKMDQFMREKGANPGRASHQLAAAASREITSVRKLIANFFNIGATKEVVFTFNATDALNLGLKGVVTKGDHVITSSMEHNSVTRPLKHLEQKGIIKLSIVKCDSETGELEMNDLEKKITDNTRLILLTHASNVTGTLMPIKKVGELAAEENIIFMVDAAQTAGVYPIDVQKLNIDLLAFSGHKGLLGPQGTGGLYINEELDLKSLRQGGTGSNSEDLYQPEEIPDKYESGTPNGVGIVGLGAGIEYIQEEGMDKLRNHKLELTDYLLTELSKMSKVKIYGPQDIKRQAPVISINLADKMASEIGFMLDRAFDIGIRDGLHCAPFAHRTLGTLEQGTVRISPGGFNNQEDCDKLIGAIKDILRQIR